MDDNLKKAIKEYPTGSIIQHPNNKGFRTVDVTPYGLSSGNIITRSGTETCVYIYCNGVWAGRLDFFIPNESVIYNGYKGAVISYDADNQECIVDYKGLVQCVHKIDELQKITD